VGEQLGVKELLRELLKGNLLEVLKVSLDPFAL